jgi:hypothetical protein
VTEKPPGTWQHLGAIKTYLKKILNWGEDNLTRVEVKGILLLATDSKGYTAWQRARKGGHLCVLPKICDMAKENLTTEEIKKKLLLATDNYGNAALYWASFSGRLLV